MGRKENFIEVLVMAADFSRRTSRLSDIETEISRLKARLDELISEQNELQDSNLAARQRMCREMVGWDEAECAEVLQIAGEPL